jgi:hypothetical protein
MSFLVPDLIKRFWLLAASLGPVPLYLHVRRLRTENVVLTANNAVALSTATSNKAAVDQVKP